MARGISAKDLEAAHVLHSTRAPDLDGNNDQADELHDKEHEGSDHDNGGQQASVRNEPEEAGDEDDAKRGDGDEVGKIPVERLASSSRGRRVEGGRTMVWAGVAGSGSV